MVPPGTFLLSEREFVSKAVHDVWHTASASSWRCLSHICAVCVLWSPWGPSTSFKAHSQEGDWQKGEETALGRSESSGSGLASSANLWVLGKALC